MTMIYGTSRQDPSAIVRTQNTKHNTHVVDENRSQSLKAKEGKHSTERNKAGESKPHENDLKKAVREGKIEGREAKHLLEKQHAQAVNNSEASATAQKMTIAAAAQLEDSSIILQLLKQQADGFVNIGSQGEFEQYLASKNFSWAFTPSEYTAQRNELFSLFKKASQANPNLSTPADVRAQLEVSEALLSRIQRAAEKLLRGINMQMQIANPDKVVPAFLSNLSKLMAKERTSHRQKRDTSSSQAVGESSPAGDDYQWLFDAISRGGRGGEQQQGGSGHSENGKEETSMTPTVDEAASPSQFTLVGAPSTATAATIHHHGGSQGSARFYGGGLFGGGFGLVGGIGGCHDFSFSDCDDDSLFAFVFLLMHAVRCVMFHLAQLSHKIDCRNRTNQQMVTALNELGGIESQAKEKAANLGADYQAIVAKLKGITPPVPPADVNLTTETFTDHTGATQNLWQFLVDNKVVDANTYNSGQNVDANQLTTLTNKVQRASECVPITWDLTTVDITFDDGTKVNFWEWLVDNNIVTKGNVEHYSNGTEVPVITIRESLQQKSAQFNAINSTDLAQLQALTSQRETLIGTSSSLIRNDKDTSAHIIQAI